MPNSANAPKNPWEDGWESLSPSGQQGSPNNPWEDGWESPSASTKATPPPLPSKMQGVETSEAGFLENFGKGAVSGTYDVGTALYSSGEAAFRPIGGTDVSLWEATNPLIAAGRLFAPETTKSVRNWIAESLGSLADQSSSMSEAVLETGEYAKGWSTGKFDRGADPDSWGVTFGKGATSVLPIIAASAATGGAAAIPAVGVYSFGSTFHEAKAAYSQQGMSEEEASSAAMLPALSQASVDMVLTKAGGVIAGKFGGANIENLTRSVRSSGFKDGVNTLAGKAGLKIKHVVKGGLTEGAIEEAPAQFIGDYLIARHTYDPAVTLETAAAGAWKSFVVGAGLGGGMGMLQKVQTPEDIAAAATTAAKRDVIRDIAPSTAAKLDEKDAASLVLPDEDVESLKPMVIEGEAPTPKPIFPQSARDKVVNEAKEKGQLPLWWDRYEGTTEPDGSTVPSGLRYADQKAVNRFIEEQEAYNELSQFTVEKHPDFDGWAVFQKGELVAEFETEARARKEARQMALNTVPKKVQARIKGYQQLTQKLSELAVLDQSYQQQLDLSKKQTAQEEAAAPAAISTEDQAFVAQTLGITPEDLQYSGLNITQEMVDQLRFAPEGGIKQFLKDAEDKRQIDSAYQSQREAAQRAEDIKAERDRAEAEAFAISAKMRLEEDSRTLSEARQLTQPQSSQQLGQLAEEQLVGTKLNATERTILNKLLDRKAALVADSVGVTDPQQTASGKTYAADLHSMVIESIDNIDTQIASLLGVPPPPRITGNELTEMRDFGGEVATETEFVPEPEPVATIKVGDTDVKVVNRTGPVEGVANAADPAAVATEIPPAVLKQLEKALIKVSKRFGSLLNLSEVQLTNLAGGAGVASMARTGVTDSILVDVERLTRSMSNKKFSVEKAIEEELLHNLDGQALRAEYAQLIRSGQLDPSTTLPQFISTKYSQIAKAMTSDERSAARQLYGVEFSDDVHMAQEFVRQLIQQRHTKSITEASYRSRPIRKLMELFSRMFSRMNLSAPLQAHVANVEGFLERTYQSEISDAHNATEKQRVKEERSQRRKQMAAIRAARKRARERKRYTREMEVLLDDKDNQNALTVLERRIPVALSSIHWMEKGTVEYEEVFSATQDEWLKQLQAGKLLEDVPNISWFKKVAQAKAKNYLSAKQAQKRGGEYQFTSIDNMQAEGLDPAAPAATKAGEEMLQYFRDNAASIGFTDKQLLALEARYRGMGGKEAAKFIGVASDSNVSQVLGSAMVKLRQAANNDPKIRQSLEDIVYRPAYAAEPQEGLSLEGFQNKKWYVNRMDEGVVGGPYNTKREAKDDFAVLGKSTKKDSVYDSMYEAEDGTVIATGESFLRAGYEYRRAGEYDEGGLVAYAADPNVEPTKPPAKADTSKDKWEPERGTWMSSPEDVGPVRSIKGIIAAAMENTFDDEVGHLGKFGGKDFLNSPYTSFEEFYGGVLETAEDGLMLVTGDQHNSDKALAAYHWLQKEKANPHPQNWANSWLEWNKRFLANQQQSDSGAAYAADPNAPSSNLPPSYKKIAKFLSKEERAKMRANTAQNIVDVFNDLPSDQNFITAARLGEAKRGWYKRASVALRQMFGGDTDQFVALLAAHSPQQSVLENLRMSLSTWTEWVNAGRPSSDAELLAIYKRVSGASLPARMGNANRALRGEGLINLSGFKVESFRKNLLGDLSASTNDTWMALFGNVSQDIFGTKSGYLGFTAKMRRVAKKLGWEPAEVQETVWSFFKTLYEAQTAGKRAGGLIKEVTDKEVSATPEFYEYLINDEQTKEKLKQLGIDISGLKSLGRLGGRGGSSATPAVDRLGPSDRAAVRRIAQRATSLKEQRLAEQEAARSSGAAYAADPAAASSPAVKFASDVLVQLGDYKRRMFRVFDSSGGLKMPSAANADTQLNFFQPKINKDAYINSVMGEVRGENRRLKKAVKEAYGDSLNKKDVAAMNNALNGNKAELNKLPPEIGEIITTMRTQIDALSNHVVKKGWVTGELKAKIGENLGTYLARSYRIFDEADYVDNIDPEVKNRAINFVEQQLRAKDSGLSASEAQLIAQSKVAEMLEEYSKDNARDMMDKGRLGEKDLGLFMKRKDIAPEIRALLGEYTDPVTNYARSVSRLAHFVGNHQFLTELKKLGMGEVFFDEKDYAARRAAGADTKIAGQVFAGVKTGDAEGDVSSGSYSPLAGLYTTKEVNQILESYDSFNKMLDGGLMKWMAKVNVFTKSMKTVASVMTNVRNLLGQPYFLLANGHNPFAFRKAHKALKAVWADAAGNSKEFQVYFNKMTRLGLVGEEITTAELRRVMGEFGSELDNAENASELLDKGTGKLLKGVKQTYAAMTRIYRASDEIGKIVHFEMEKEALRPIRPEATEVELEAEAAERTRGGVPTYSMLPPTVQRIRTQPFVGPFMSFFYEAARTQVMNVKYAAVEWDKGNYAYASRRIGGHLAATVGMGYVLQLASKALFGISDEEEESFREFLPDWEKDSQFILWRDEEGQLQYSNISYNNPYSATTDKLLAMAHISGRPEEGIAKNIVTKAKEMLDPFTSETIAAQAVLNIHSNKDSYGNKLWNEQADTEDKVAAAVSHAAKALTPATIERAWNKWRPAYQGKHLPKSARVPVLGDELLAEVTGFRIRTMDYEDAMLHSSFGAASSISESNRIFNQIAGRGGIVTDAEMLDAYEKANEARFRNFQQMSKKVRAAQLGGVKRGKVLSTMKTGKMSASDISHILNEKFRPMSPSPQIIKKARDKGHAIPMQAINEIKRRWRNTPLFEDGE